MLRTALLVSAAATAYAGSCTFCSAFQGQYSSFDLSTIFNGTIDVPGYSFTTPCGLVDSLSCGRQNTPMTQSCLELGTLANISVDVTNPSEGFVLTLHGGFDVSSHDEHPLEFFSCGRCYDCPKSCRTLPCRKAAMLYITSSATRPCLSTMPPSPT